MTGKVTVNIFRPDSILSAGKIHGRQKEKTLISEYISNVWTAKQSVFQRTKKYTTMLSECISTVIILKAVFIRIAHNQPIWPTTLCFIHWCYACRHTCKSRTPVFAAVTPGTQIRLIPGDWRNISYMDKLLYFIKTAYVKHKKQKNSAL